MTQPDVGQIWRDKDKRSLSGRRHCKVIRLGVKMGNGEAYAVMAPVYRNTAGQWTQHREGESMATKVSFKTLTTKWVYAGKGD